MTNAAPTVMFDSSPQKKGPADTAGQVNSARESQATGTGGDW